MGVYYRYVNHTRREFVDPDSTSPDADPGEESIVRCGCVLAYLMLPPPPPGRRTCEFRGRWGGDPSLVDDRLVPEAAARAAQAVAVVADSCVDFEDMDRLGYVDISDPLIVEMRREWRWRDALDRTGSSVSVAVLDGPDGAAELVRKIRDFCRDQGPSRRPSARLTLTIRQAEALLSRIERVEKISRSRDHVFDVARRIARDSAGVAGGMPLITSRAALQELCDALRDADASESEV